MKISMQEVARILRSQEVAPSASTPTNGNGKATGTNGNGHAASVEISAAAHEVQRVKHLVNEMPDTRAELVESIKARVESGAYAVSGEEIADLMIRRALADHMR